MPTAETDTQQPSSPTSSAALAQYPDRELGRAGSVQNGQTLVVIGGVHGNERAGLIAGQRVLDRLGELEHPELNGQLVVLAGNLAALNHADPDTRYIDSDLNRLCREDQFLLPASASIEHAEMFGLFDALESVHTQCADADQQLIVLDLHTTSAPSRPIVAFEDSLAAREHAMRMPCPKYLGIEEEASGLVIDAVTQRFGCVSYLIEGGQHENPDSARVLEAGIWIAMANALIIDLDQIKWTQFDGHDPAGFLSTMSGHRGMDVFDVRHREPILNTDFAICDGIVSGTKLVAGKTKVAMQAGHPMHAPISGRMFLPNMQTHKRVCDDGFFIVRRVSSGWVNLSARIRKQSWVHSLIGAFPGVYRVGDEKLLIDADLACVLRRQFFHLFGYRLIDHDDRKGGVGVRRFVNGIQAFTQSILRGRVKDPESLIGDRDQDHTQEQGRQESHFWIVQRRRLDR
ncbi:MAG: succinylglutamate desuccinylase/aspartoacylase family protein [Phycisphaerales bacterium]